MNGSGDPYIFLVDADEVVRDSLKVLIESHGLRVKDYRNAADFLADVGSTHGTCLVYGCNRHIMDGIDLMNRLRSKGVEMPVIFIVGGGSPLTKAAVVAAHAGAYLESPVEEETLMRAIKAMLKPGNRDKTRRRLKR